MSAKKRVSRKAKPDREAPGPAKATSTDPSWRIVAICAVLLVIYLWLHADALRLLLGGFSSR